MFLRVWSQDVPKKEEKSSSSLFAYTRNAEDLFKNRDKHSCLNTGLQSAALFLSKN